MIQTVVVSIAHVNGEIEANLVPNASSTQLKFVNLNLYAKMNMLIKMLLSHLLLKLKPSTASTTWHQFYESPKSQTIRWIRPTF